MKKYIVLCIGRRRNYDVASILSKESMLDKLITDFYCYGGKIKYEKLVRFFFPDYSIKAMQSCYNPSIQDSSVISSWSTGFYQRFMLKIFPYSKHNAYIPATKHLSKITAKTLENSNISAVYGYDTAAVEIFKTAKCKGFFNALEQCVAPRKAQIKMHKVFEHQYGQSFKKEIQCCEILEKREQEEWSLSDTILVPSSYVRNQMLLAGVQDNKIKLVPYGFEIPQNIPPIETMINKRMENREIFKILFVGNSSLRKGIQDIAKIAKILETENIEFRIAGAIDSSIIKWFNIDKMKNIKLMGILDKQRLYEEYQNADMFILPSYLEGSAMVILEALSFGLPVVTTEESGSCITSGIDGFVCKAGEVETMVSNIENLMNETELRYKISHRTTELLQNSSFQNYHKNLINALK